MNDKTAETEEQTYYFEEKVLSVALHRSMKCPHGVGADPKPLPEGFMDADNEMAALIAEEYRTVYEEAKTVYVEGLLDELVADGLLEKVETSA